MFVEASSLTRPYSMAVTSVQDISCKSKIGNYGYSTKYSPGEGSSRLASRGRATAKVVTKVRRSMYGFMCGDSNICLVSEIFWMGKGVCVVTRYYAAFKCFQLLVFVTAESSHMKSQSLSWGDTAAAKC